MALIALPTILQILARGGWRRLAWSLLMVGVVYGLVGLRVWWERRHGGY